MPTTRMKNTFYRLALPLLAPRPGRDCLLPTEGRALSSLPAYRGLIRRHHVLGSACLLVSGESTAYLYTRSISPDHNPVLQPVFRVASITKMATALLTLVCVDRGLVSLDQPFISCMPAAFSDLPSLRGVTLRHLLSHTSGIMDPPDLESSLEQGCSVLDVLRDARFAEPGTCFRYSNLGFGLFGCLFDVLFDRPFPTVFDELIFRPLGCRATLDASALDPALIMPVTRILPYHAGRDVTITPLGRRPVTAPDPLHHYGHTAGSMYIDADSLLRLTDCLRHHGAPLISPELGAEMSRQHASYGAASPTLSYGLGLLRIRDPRISDSALLGHQGFAYGCADGAFWEEDTGRTVIFLNGGCSEAREGRLGLCNRDVLKWAFRKEFPHWN